MDRYITASSANQERVGAAPAIAVTARRAAVCVDLDRAAEPDDGTLLVTRHKSQRIRSEHLTPEGFLIYKESIRVLRKPYQQSKPSRGDRREIVEFSDKAKRNLRFNALNSRAPLISHFCLTYHDCTPADGRDTKKHLNRFLNKLRRRFPGVCYLWVLEFQKRGTPHYHVFLSLECTKPLHRELATMWAEIVDPGNNSLLKFHLHALTK